MSVDLFDTVRLMVIGMGVVFASLIALYLVMVLITWILGQEVGPTERAATPERKPTPPPAPTPEASPVSEEVAAVISGAVYTTLGPQARVRSIRPGGGSSSRGPSVWALAGRQEAMMPETAYRQRTATVRPRYTRGEDARG